MLSLMPNNGEGVIATSVQRWVRTWYPYSDFPRQPRNPVSPAPGMSRMTMRDALMEGAASVEFWAALPNWSGSWYGCRSCPSRLEKIIFPEGREFEIITDDPASPRIAIKTLFSCAHCKRFVTPAAPPDNVLQATERLVLPGGVVATGRLEDSRNFEYECGSMAEYQELLKETDAIGTTVGGQAAGFIRLDEHHWPLPTSGRPRRAFVEIRESATAAWGAADVMADPYYRAVVLKRIARALALAGDAPAARVIADAAQEAAADQLAVALATTSGVYERQEALGKAAGVLSSTGLATAALAAAGAISGGFERAEALIRVAETLAAAGDGAGARQAAVAARAATNTIPEPFLRASQLAKSAWAFAAAGDTSAALEAADGARLAADAVAASANSAAAHAERVAALQGPEYRETDLELAQLGARVEAQQAAEALGFVALALASAGNSPAALDAADGIEDPEVRATRLVWVARRLASGGDTSAAGRAASAARAALAAINDPHRRGEALTQVAETLAASGYEAAALATCDIDTYPFSFRPTALIRVAGALAAAGNAPAARKASGVARAAVDDLVNHWPPDRASDLAGIAKALAVAGDRSAARDAAEQARAAAFAVWDDESAWTPTGALLRDPGVAESLFDAAMALAAAGDAPAARHAAAVAWAVAVTSDKGWLHATLLASAAEVLAALGDASAARQAANSISDPSRRAFELTRIVEALVARTDPFDHQSADAALAKAFDDPDFRTQARTREADMLAEVTKEYAEVVDSPHAARKADPEAATAPAERRPPPASPDGGRRVAQGSSKGGCYVATAVYGSYDCPQVWVLRRWRDHQLASTSSGRQLVRLYYRVSPAVVRAVGNERWFAYAVRRPLDRFVARLRASGYSSLPYSDQCLTP